MHDTITGILKDKSTPASILLAVVLKEYGTSCLEWESEVLRLEILEDFGIELSPIQSDKLQAAIVILSTDFFENDWHVFNSCIHALNGEPFEHDTFSPIDAEQIAAAMPEVQLIRNDLLGEGLEFSDEVNIYAGFIFSEYGLFFAPNEFSSAIIPSLTSDHYSDSQGEKKESLNQIYTAKKTKIQEYLDCLKHVLLV